MTTKLLLAAALLAAGPLYAAEFTAPEGLAQTVAAARAMGAAKKAARAASAPTKEQRSRFDALVDRLIKDGSVVSHPAGALHAFQKAERKGNVQREVAVGVIETPGAPGEGRIGAPDSDIRDLVERHTYAGVEVQVMTITVKDGGTAALDSRIYLLDMSGALVGGTQQVNAEGALTQDNAVQFDDAKTQSRRLTPSEAKAAWDSLLPELLKMGRVVDI